MSQDTRSSESQTGVDDEVSRNSFEYFLLFRRRLIVRNLAGRLHATVWNKKGRGCEWDKHPTLSGPGASLSPPFPCPQFFMATLTYHFTSAHLYQRCRKSPLVSSSTSSSLHAATRIVPTFGKPSLGSFTNSSRSTFRISSRVFIGSSLRVVSGVTRSEACWRRHFATSSSEGDSEAPWGDRAAQTRSRYLKNQKKSRSAKGRAFKDVVGYGDMVAGVEAGLSPARAMRKARKLQPKPFCGKVAMYFANTSTEPLPVITQETLESMPSPNSIRTVKSIRVSSDVLGSNSTNTLIDYVTEMQQNPTSTPESIQRQMSKMIQTAKEASVSLSVLQASQQQQKQQLQLQSQHQEQQRHHVSSSLSPSSSNAEHRKIAEDVNVRDMFVAKEEEEEEEDAIFDDAQDDLMELDSESSSSGVSPSYRPIRINPEEDIEFMSPQTREAVTKVRKVFQGSLTWCQPIPGEITDFFEQQRQRKATLPSQRSALTSATASSVRTILAQSTASHVDLGLKKGKAKALSKLEPKRFFDISKLNELGSTGYTKTKRSGSETQGLLKDVINLPQVCVVGRSNVGKSSLLNSIMGPKFDKLRVSRTPGRTQLVQMLTVSEKLVVVDMPGYGYAAASPSARKAMEQRIGEYLTSRLPKRVFMLIDARRGVGKSDARLADSLEQLKLVYQIVLTKIDKVTNVEQAALVEKNIASWISRRSCAMPQIIKTSSKERSGLDQLRLAIYLACGFEL